MPGRKLKRLMLILLGLALVGMLPVYLSGRLAPSMTDEEMLRALDLDPAKMRSKFTQGKDGHSTEYMDGVNEVMILRSSFSGVYVERRQPFRQEWELGSGWRFWR